MLNTLSNYNGMMHQALVCQLKLEDQSGYNSLHPISITSLVTLWNGLKDM